MNLPMQPDHRLKVWQKLGLLLIMALGFGLRFGGLNHDLNEWQEYHPDTSKQIRAVERFLDGQYYYHVGDLDYDAYAYFNSHLVEYLCRAGDALHGGLQALLGLPASVWRPDYYELFWITRSWNAMLATLLILVVFQLARENWDVQAAFVAALFLAVSPADVTSAHFAGSDTTAGFFATVAVFFAFRIYRLGRVRDYAWAALFTACGFSTKYHAGMALLPILLAHGLRMGAWRALVGARSLGRLLLLAVVGISVTFLTTPTLLTHFGETVRNICAFFTQITSYRGVDDSIRHGAWSTKIIFAMHRNLPILIWIVGLLPCFGAVLGLKDLLRRRPEPRAVVLYALPLLYFLLGVSLRPMAHPYYHTLMTPLVFVAAAVAFTRPFARPENDHVWFAGLRLAVIGIAALLLFKTAARETFLWFQQDVSRVARAWAEENVPPQFAAQLENYSFSSSRFAAPGNCAGGIWAATRPEAPPATFTLLKTFSLETERMAVFRNIPIRLYADSSAWLRPDFQMPIGQRAASLSGNRVSCDNGPEFLRSEKILTLELTNAPTVRWLVRAQALDEAWLGVQNGDMANFVEVSLGGARFARSLPAGAVAWWRVVAPQPHWPSESEHSWYRWSAAAYGRARVLLATRPEEMGLFLFNTGCPHDAFPLLQRAAAATRNPALATLALCAAQNAQLAMPSATQAGLARCAQPLQEVHDAASCRKLFGIAPEYLHALDFITLDATELHFKGCHSVKELDVSGQRLREGIATGTGVATNGPPLITTPLLYLDPGAYTLTLRVRGLSPTNTSGHWRLSVRDAFGHSFVEQDMEFPPLRERQDTRVTAAFSLGTATSGVRLFLKPQEPAGVVLDQMTIKPDVLATLQWLNRQRQHPAVSPPATAPVAGFQQPVNTLFAGGLRIASLQCSSATLRRGQPVGVNLELGFEEPGLNPANLIVFIHFNDAAGRTVFQGDYPLLEWLRGYMPHVVEPVLFCKAITIPPDASPGVYTICLGVCRLDNSKRLRILATALPQKTKAVLLQKSIRVTE